VVSKKGLKLHEAERDAAAAGPAPAGDSGVAAEKGRSPSITAATA